MTETTKRHMQLVRDLVSLYVDHPKQLKVTVTELGVKASGEVGTVYWRMQGTGEGHGKLAGRGGANFHALRFLIEVMGAVRETTYSFQLVDPATPSPQRNGGCAAPLVEDYDPEPVRAVVERYLAAVAEAGASVRYAGIAPGREVLTHRLAAAFADAGDLERVQRPVLDALNTVLRAMQRKQGASIDVVAAMAGGAK